MKKTIISLTIIFQCMGLISQVPQKMSYQAIIRDNNGSLIKNSTVNIKVSIIPDSETNAPVFSESHLVSTNSNGQVSLVIGDGNIITGSIVSISWGSHQYFIKTETDPEGGNNYKITGISQLLSVPYALYANNSYWSPYGGPGIYKYLGNIGMGNYPSDFRLELTESDTKKGLRILGGTDSNSKLFSVSSYGTVEVDDHSVEGGRLMIKTGGNVGIGETNPTERLVVNGKTKTTNLQVTNGASEGKVLTSDANGNATWQNSISNWAIIGNNLYNTNAGDIGIGTNNPEKYSNIFGTKIVEVNSEYGSHIVLSSQQPTSGHAIGSITWGSKQFLPSDKRIALLQVSSSNYSITEPKGDMKFYTNNGTGLIEAFGITSSGTVNVSSAGEFLVDKPSIPGGRLKLTNDGYLGIGNLNPTRPLSFPATIGEKILLYPGTTGEVGIGVYGNELRMHIDVPNGKVSFGSQDNSGNFTEFGKFEKSGAYALSVFGSIWANGVTYASDERFKKNIGPLNEALSKLKLLRGVEYELKNEFTDRNFSDKRQTGLIAQEVEKVVPEAVSDVNGYKGVDYARLVPLLIESIKEQQKQIEMLENRIKLLEKKN